MFEALNLATLGDPITRRELEDGLKKWLSRFGLQEFGSRIVEHDRVKAGCRDDTGTRVELAMGSHGNRQISTVITQLIVAPRHSVIMIEEPEISLHPKLQALLPLLFADAILKYGKQVIVTTHSSTLALAVSDVISGSEEYPDIGRLSADDVALYHVTRDGQGWTNVQRIELTKEEYPTEIPLFAEVEMRIFNRMLRGLG